MCVWVCIILSLSSFCMFFFFFKQKTAYEMRISDWSSDVCSSDLECVRWTSPLLSFMRTAERDYTLRDQTIRKGDWLMLSYPSANRDEDVFEEPFVFKANRTPNPQIGFGYGPPIGRAHV